MIARHILLAAAERLRFTPTPAQTEEMMDPWWKTSTFSAHCKSSGSAAAQPKVEELRSRRQSARISEVRHEPPR